ncbi:hypothetical protein [Tichowtungia aerotolerans]|uniref:Uncharacterized protein n=1 Tax=Tichowtungia aerotolerans TaxID=2697043 RepID=A0A6P1M7H7_9BACT|nr:hypothetical protein [Tichowtungia aerotolerans]QHI69817.1 hypothetical protein GT409_10270 [Tichowtungia aerotolerans]
MRLRHIAAAALTSVVSNLLGGIPEPSSGYPRPMSFRSINRKAVDEGCYDRMDMVVSDLHTYVRKDAAKTFKQKFPDRLALIQINMERLGFWGSWEMLPVQRFEDLEYLEPEKLNHEPQLELLRTGKYPLFDFPGWWTYDAGDSSLGDIPADTEIITVQVSKPEHFRPTRHPVTRRNFKELFNRDAYHREVVICPRDAEGKLDWLNAEMGKITALDEAQGTVTIRRWKTSKGWKAYPAGTYIAANSVELYIRNELKHLFTRPDDAILQPWLPNLTDFCPRDPRTGLNAREFLAQWYANFKTNDYPTLDGLVFDVSVGTFYPSTRISGKVDCNNDGEADAFFFDNINYWPLGIYDFFYTLRNGLPGVFKGTGDDCILMGDSNHNEDQRFFDLLNGGEYEYSMHPVWFMPCTYSSMLDRLLLWKERGCKPDSTFVSNKNPDEIYHGGDALKLTGVMTLSHWRMDMASACMTSGYAGKDISRSADKSSPELIQYPAAVEQRKKYRFPLPPDYDEYHEGVLTNYNWLGRPVGEATRIGTHLSPVLYRFEEGRKPPVMHAKGKWDAGQPERDKHRFSLNVDQVDLWREDKDSWSCYAELDLGKTRFEKDADYTLTFTVSGSNPWKKLKERYRRIPKNIRFRLAVNGIEEVDFGNFDGSYFQEALVFEEPRTCTLTLKAPADGTGVLQIDLTENTGETVIENLQIRKGCGDVLYRKFENGLVILNGSYSEPAAVDFRQLFPGESYCRINGLQDPEHNNGKPVVKPLTVQPHDAFFLRKTQ